MKKQFLALLISLVSTGMLFSQGKSISGTVLDDANLPMPGVTVLEKGTQNGTTTDLDGKYTVNVNSDQSILVFSFIGFQTVERVVGENSNIDIALKIDATDLDPVVVIGYGNQKRSKISGAVSTIKPEEITKAPVLRTEQALQGRTSGVQVTQNSGQPGSTQSIRIRGTSSINNAEPLFVIDGIPSFGIDYLNPADIESISILKDAASAAIYGARGGNGVVLITTKQGGKNDRAQITYDAYAGIQEPWKQVAVLNAEEYAIIMNESRASAGLIPEPALSNPSILGEGTDWQDAIFERAPIMSHSLNFLKGSGNNSTAIGGSYFVQDGIVGGDKGEFERYTFRVNTRHEAGEKFRIGQNFNFTHLTRNALAENNEFASPIIRALNMDPVTPVSRPDGTFSYSQYIDSDIANPVNQIETTHDRWTTNRLVGSVFGEYDLFSNFTFRSTFSVDLSLGSQKIFFPTFDLGIGPNDPNRPAFEFRETNALVRAENKWANWQWENMATYDLEFENGNRLKLTGGYSALFNDFQNLVGSRDSLATNDPEQAFLDNSLNFREQTPQASGGIGQSSFLSTFLRANYEIGDEFSFAGTVRRDGSSRFGANNRYGIFPSASAAWNLTEKSFIKGQEWIDFLKVRASWGRNGNADGIGNYDYTSLVINGLNYSFGSDQFQVNGAGPLFTSNPDLKWETVEQTNVGFDADLINGKINFVFDYFIKDTKDMLAAVPLPGVVGLLPSATNVASARNSGIEIALGYRNRDKAFKYNVNGNISFIKNEVTDLGEGGQPISTGNVFGSGDFVAYTEIGQPIAYFYGFETAGIFQTDEAAAANLAQPDAQAGDIIFVDQNSDGVIDGNDKVMIGNPHPDFTFGLVLEAEYKNFDWSVFLQGTSGNDLFNGMFRYDLNTTNYPISALERWTGEGSTNENPRISHNNANQNNRVSDRFVEDGSFTRVKNMQLGYTLPNRIIKRLDIQKLRVYVAAQNLWTFTSYSGFDPEIGTRGTLEIGIDRGFYPAARMFMTGVNVTF
ncbi:MAG: TonB-dependent receptor [Bacteroidota bacterium]